jgi:TolB protein
VRALQPLLATDVGHSFARLRRRTHAESGYDFLGVLNDAWRGLDHPGGAYLSWHKAGRAIDVRDWYAPTGRRSLFITRQNLGDMTYFRIYLRAARQDGSQGAPLRESMWETEGRLADPLSAAAGGRALPPLAGYYVDFTDLAAREGWTRIPARTPPDGDWRRNYLDLEFWHYERRDGLRWYEAMRGLYDADLLQARFSAELVRARGYTPRELLSAGIPGAFRPNSMPLWRRETWR